MSQKLIDAIWQALDDMGEHGHRVCEATKAQLRMAVEPHLDDMPTPDYSIESAKAVLKELGLL